MKLLREIPSKEMESQFFDICLKSKSGCNVRVGDRHYNVYVDNGQTVVKEFKLDFELTEEEFKKLK